MSTGKQDDRDDGGPAFPETRWDDKSGQEVQWLGMTLRDYFAGRAMQGELTTQTDAASSYSTAKDIKDLAEWSYDMADAMLKARQP